MAAPRRITATARSLATSLAGPSSSRAISTTAVAHASSADASSSSSSSSSTSSGSLRTSLLLSRPPLLLRQPTELESTYFAYNAKIRRALSQPFPRDLYFKKGSAAETKFLQEEAKRDADMGFVDAGSKGGKGKGGKKTEAGAPVSSSSTSSGEDMYEALPRTTPADEKNDTSSLQRKLDRTLFLVVKRQGDPNWRFPDSRVKEEMEKDGKVRRENLHVAAPEAVKTLLGRDMDIWLVSNMPVGVLQPGQGVLDKTYFLKAHILAGNPSTEGSGPKEKGKVQYAWLTREEIEERLGEGKDQEYWEGVKELLEE